MGDLAVGIGRGIEINNSEEVRLLQGGEAIASCGEV